MYVSGSKLHTPGAVLQNAYEIRLTNTKVKFPGMMTEKHYLPG